MEMEMRIAEIIHNYSLVDFDKKRGVVYVPTAAFEKEGITLHDLMLGFSLLSKKGLHNHEQRKGQMEQKDTEKIWRFHEISETDIENWKKSGDTEMLDSIETAWRITINQKQLEALVRKSKPIPVQPQRTGKMILYYTNDGELYKETRDKSYSPTRDGIPFKVFKFLVENPNVDYKLGTDDMASELGLTASRLRNEIGKLKKAVAGSLGLKGSLVLIEAKKGSGYRLNPYIEIIRTE